MMASSSVKPPLQVIDASQESKLSLPHQLSRADFGNLLFELCVKLGFNNVNQLNPGD